MKQFVRCLLMLAFFASPASAQLGPGPYSAFPTSDVTDGRFLGFGCPGFATFESGVSITLAAGASESSFTLSIFDGDTSGAVPTGHWDVGTRRLAYRLYFDPFRQSNTNPADLVGEWFGNTANPLTNPDPNPAKAWTASAATMPDNDWWGVQVVTAPNAQSVPGANYFYHLRIEADGACVGSEQLESNIKIAASNPLNFAAPRFAFVAALRQVANDIPIIYPGAPPFPTPPPGGYVNFPTTFDGTFTFALNLPPGTTNFELFDGDWDFGTNPAQLVGSPSGVPLTACLDTDDANTPANYSDFPPALGTVGANPEGVVTAGIPPDDNRLDLFRRGEPGSPGRVGCVRYEVTDPLGNVFRNDNPSSNLEWERFRVVSAGNVDAGNPAAYDYLVPTPFLAPGTWTVRLLALDMSNLNFVYADLGVCSNITDTQSFGTLDFEQDSAGNTLPDGTEIAEQFASQGIHFSTNDPVNHPLVIFDSNLATIDPDLGTPNEDFGGAGIGAGGGLGQPGENSVEQLNILIIGDVETAQSFPGGGVVTATFNGPREVTSVDLIDITTVGGTVTAYDAMVGGSVIASAPIVALGENSFQRVSLGSARNTRRLEISLSGEGGIANIISGPGGTVPNCPPPLFALGDTVWYDPNGNAVQSLGEPGISGVSMELLAVGNPTPVATAITGDATNPDFATCRQINTGLDEAGLYCFLVPPGNYTVRVAASNFLTGGPLASLASTTGGESQTDTVGKTNVLTYDFGYRGTASLGDRVWIDSNGDGVQDGGEGGINGVTVELLDAGNNVIATRVTAGDGNYTFANLLAGTYTVRVVTATLPAGLTQTFDLDGLGTAHQATATLAGGENRTDVDFGYREVPVFGSLGDRVWLDLDGDGGQDGGEPGINAVTVRLIDGGGTQLATAVTAGDGNYLFPNLAAGTYTVEVVASGLPAGMVQTFDLDGLGTAHRASATLAAAQNRTDVDFGYRPGLCAVRALNDAVYGPGDGNHAFWLPGISTDLTFDPPGSWVELPDGSAYLTGTVKSPSNPGFVFQATVSFSNRTNTAPAGSPKLELSAGAYVSNGGPVNPATWHYYQTYSGTLTGSGAAAGAQINFARTGPAFQVGTGANGKNINFGASGWFNWTVVAQPATPLPATGQGDINIDIRSDCTEICADGTFIDRFDSASFANNNGTRNWSGPWIEDDVAGAGPTAGNVKIHNGILTLDDAPDTGTSPSAAREADVAGATSVTLAFDFLTSAGVDADDAVVVEVSSNGGASYTVLETFTNITGAVSGARTYNISAFASSRLRVRFRVKNLYGGDNELFCVDNVKITVVCQQAVCAPRTLKDHFDTASFSNNNGTASWAGPWQEYDVSGAGPAAGNVQVHDGLLTLQDSPDTGTQPSAAREADLTGFSGATLSFDFLTSAGVDPSDAVVVEISKDGGATYTVLETFTNITGAVSGSRSYNISAHMSNRMRVRFRVKSNYGVSDELFCVDNLKIVTTCPPGSLVTLSLRVDQGADDAEEKVAGGAMYLNSTDLELVDDVGDRGLQWVGLRFRGVEIPKNATITSAVVEFTVDEVDSIGTALTIRGQAAGNAPTFSTNAYNISSRAKTTASVSWNPAAWSVVGAAQSTPDLKTVVQEIVNGASWASGNSLAMILNGSGERTAESFDGSATQAPLLRVTFVSP